MGTASPPANDTDAVGQIKYGCKHGISGIQGKQSRVLKEQQMLLQAFSARQ